MYKAIRVDSTRDINDQTFVCLKIYKTQQAAFRFAAMQNDKITNKVLGFEVMIYDAKQNQLLRVTER